MVVATLSILLGGGGGASAVPPPSLKAAAEAGYDVSLLPAFTSALAAVATPSLRQMSGLPADPKHEWQFTVACYGYLQLEGMNQPELRFRVYAQHLDDLTSAQNVCRLLLRLQELAWQKLRLQVNLQGERTLNVWLCRQGNPGGEQWRNNLYIYAVHEIRRPMDWLREITHEFSHALIPGITGYHSPEPWANGYVGERLLLSWVASLLQEGQLSAEDVAGAPVADVRRFVQQRCLPLRQMWTQQGFPERDFRRTDTTGMSALIGLVLYIDGIYGSHTLRSTFARLAEPQPLAFWKAFTEALSESEAILLTPVEKVAHVWLPAGGWTIQTEDKQASLSRGKERWQATQKLWRLPANGWYLLRTSATVRLTR